MFERGEVDWVILMRVWWMGGGGDGVGGVVVMDGVMVVKIFRCH